MKLLDEYIRQIKENDIELTDINLAGQGLGDEDVERLMRALQESPKVAERIVSIDLRNNNMTKINIPRGLNGLQRLRLDSNRLKSFHLTVALPSLKLLSICFNQELASVKLPEKLKSLEELHLTYNKLKKLDLPPDATKVKKIVLGPTTGDFKSLTFPKEYVALEQLHIMGTKLTEFVVPKTLVNLIFLRVSHSCLVKFKIPRQCNKLATLCLERNELEELDIPPELNRLFTLDVGHNKLASVSIPNGLTRLKNVDVFNNRLSILTLLKLFKLSRDKNLDIEGLSFPDFSKQRSEAILTYLEGQEMDKLQECFRMCVQENQHSKHKIISFAEWLSLLELQGVSAKICLGSILDSTHPEAGYQPSKKRLLY